MATMSAVALLFFVSTVPGVGQYPAEQTPDPHEPFVGGSFIPSTANEIFISNYSSAEMDDFVMSVNNAYNTFAEKQQRLDGHMADVVADSLWDLYITD